MAVNGKARILFGFDTLAQPARQIPPAMHDSQDVDAALLDLVQDEMVLETLDRPRADVCQRWIVEVSEMTGAGMMRDPPDGMLDLISETNRDFGTCFTKEIGSLTDDI